MYTDKRYKQYISDDCIAVPSCKEPTSEVVSETECNEITYYEDDSQVITHEDPVNPRTNVLVLTSGVVRDSADMFFQRAVRLDMWFIYISITVINILFLISSIFGVTSEWYKNINRSRVNPYIIGTLWIIATILSYGAIFMIWEHVKPNEVMKDMRISLLFLVGSFLSFLWTTVLFQGNNIVMAVWISSILFLYQFWLFIYVMSMNVKAALFMIPIVIMYGYLFYSMVHLASINNIKL